MKKKFKTINKEKNIGFTLIEVLIALCIFNEFGLGLLDDYSLSVAWAIGLAVLALQIMFSHFWLSQFKQGPIEYLWRKAIPA